MGSPSVPKLPPAPSLVLTTLGAWSLARTEADESGAGGAPFGQDGPAIPAVGALGSSKPLALFVYLALAPRRTARREQLLDLLWADLEPTAAAHALRQTLWFLRQRFGDGVVTSAGGEVRIGVPVSIDRDAFLAAVEARDLERAATLYRGEFLPGFAAPGGAEFERWADNERDRLRRTFLRTAEALVRHLLDAARFRDAIAVARRARDADPEIESGWRLLIEALCSSGGTLRAAVEADTLERLLAEEHREPEPATRAALRLARQISEVQVQHAGRGDREGRGGPAGLVTELVGREREFSAILRAWDAARRGSARHVHVTAPSGFGKSRLLADVQVRLRSAGARCVLLRAYPGEQRIPQAVASDLANALAALPGAAAIPPAAVGALMALTPALSARFPGAVADVSTGDEALRRRTIALGELVAAVADEAPLALLVDDLHWADAASRQALGTLAAHLANEPVLIVTATRPTTEGTVPEAGASQLSLAPLTPQEIGGMVASLGALPDEPWAADFAVRLELATQGSPLLVLETLQLLLERGLLLLGEDGWHCTAAEEVLAALGEGRALRQRLGRLDGDKRMLLLALAVTGSPVTTAQLVAHVQRDAAGIVGDLDELEQRGYLAHVGDTWAPAHDEIAHVAIEMAPPEALRAAHRGVGRAGAREGDRDPSLLVRAALHLAQAGETGEVGRVFTQWFYRQRQRGDRRSARALAAEFLAPEPGDDEARNLVRRLPMSARLGLYSTVRRIAAAAVLLGAATLGALIVMPRGVPAADEELIVISRAPGQGSFRALRVPIRADRWDDTRPLEAAEAGVPYPTIRASADWDANAVYSSARDAWAVTRLMPGAAVQDLFLIHADGREARLTDSPGDDLAPAWAPDGSLLAFVTSRWSLRSWYHVAVLDPDHPGQVRQLTRGPASESSPKWSRDGTRIAFLRRYPAARQPRPVELCWVTLEGREPVCREPRDGFRFSGLSKWLGPTHIAAVVDSAGLLSLASVGVDDGSVTIIRRNTVAGAASPDGEWMVGIVGDAAENVGSWVVFPVSRPDRAVTVRLNGEASSFVLRWGRAVRNADYIDHLVIDQPSRHAQLGSPHQLRARGVTAQGDTVSIPSQRWWSADTAVALVNDSGTLLARVRGPVFVHVTAGGWRSDSTAVYVTSDEPTTVAKADWRVAAQADWIRFGSPMPTTLAGPGGVPALWNRGDGVFASGVYSRGAYSASDGLGVEARFSSPITAVQWQTLVLQLHGTVDTDSLAHWDHRTGPLPQRSAAVSTTDVCSAAAPFGEGSEWMRELGFSAGQSTGHLTLPSQDLTGRWYTVRLQILPDGRCGAALDGTPVWISRRPISTHLRYRVVLSGNSVGTRMLFGPVEVWQGVRSGIDWAALERPAGGSARVKPVKR